MPLSVPSDTGNENSINSSDLDTMNKKNEVIDVLSPFVEEQV